MCERIEAKQQKSSKYILAALDEFLHGVTTQQIPYIV